MADGIAAGHFLLLTAPDEVRAELVRKAEDPDAYLIDQSAPADGRVSLRVVTSDFERPPDPGKEVRDDPRRGIMMSLIATDPGR